MDFSSVNIIINLQTWVLLLDYLGIGIPTPPPSRPDTPDCEDTFPGPAVKTGLKGRATDAGGGRGSKKKRDAMEDSLLADARDMLSLDESLYVSTYQAMGDGDPGGASDESALPLRDRSGGKRTAAPDTGDTGEQNRDEGPSSVWGVEGKTSLRLKLNVNSLTVTFNKPEHPLARGGVSGVSAEVKLMQGNMEVSGSLGQGSVLDMTETGAYYRER